MFVPFVAQLVLEIALADLASEVVTVAGNDVAVDLGVVTEGFVVSSFDLDCVGYGVGAESDSDFVCHFVFSLSCKFRFVETNGNDINRYCQHFEGTNLQRIVYLLKLIQPSQPFIGNH